MRPRRLGQEQGLRTAALNPISVSFSEINQPDINRHRYADGHLDGQSLDALGTRTSKTTKVYLMADDLLPQDDQVAETKEALSGVRN